MLRVENWCANYQSQRDSLNFGWKSINNIVTLMNDAIWPRWIQVHKRFSLRSYKWFSVFPHFLLSPRIDRVSFDTRKKETKILIGNMLYYVRTCQNKEAPLKRIIFSVTPIKTNDPEAFINICIEWLKGLKSIFFFSFAYKSRRWLQQNCLRRTCIFTCKYYCFDV